MTTINIPTKAKNIWNGVTLPSLRISDSSSDSEEHDDDEGRSDDHSVYNVSSYSLSEKMDRYIDENDVSIHNVKTSPLTTISAYTPGDRSSTVSSHVSEVLDTSSFSDKHPDVYLEDVAYDSSATCVFQNYGDQIRSDSSHTTSSDSISNGNLLPHLVNDAVKYNDGVEHSMMGVTTNYDVTGVVKDSSMDVASIEEVTDSLNVLQCTQRNEPDQNMGISSFFSASAAGSTRSRIEGGTRNISLSQSTPSHGAFMATFSSDGAPRSAIKESKGTNNDKDNDGNNKISLQTKIATTDLLSQKVMTNITSAETQRSIDTLNVKRTQGIYETSVKALQRRDAWIAHQILKRDEMLRKECTFVPQLAKRSVTLATRLIEDVVANMSQKTNEDPNQKTAAVEGEEEKVDDGGDMKRTETIYSISKPNESRRFIDDNFDDHTKVTCDVSIIMRDLGEGDGDEATCKQTMYCHPINDYSGNRESEMAEHIGGSPDVIILSDYISPKAESFDAFRNGDTILPADDAEKVLLNMSDYQMDDSASEICTEHHERKNIKRLQSGIDKSRNKKERDKKREKRILQEKLNVCRITDSKGARNIKELSTSNNSKKEMGDSAGCTVSYSKYPIYTSAAAAKRKYHRGTKISCTTDYTTKDPTIIGSSRSPRLNTLTDCSNIYDFSSLSSSSEHQCTKPSSRAVRRRRRDVRKYNLSDTVTQPTGKALDILVDKQYFSQLRQYDTNRNTNNIKKADSSIHHLDRSCHARNKKNAFTFINKKSRCSSSSSSFSDGMSMQFKFTPTVNKHSNNLIAKFRKDAVDKGKGILPVSLRLYKNSGCRQLRGSRRLILQRRREMCIRAREAKQKIRTGNDSDKRVDTTTIIMTCSSESEKDVHQSERLKNRIRNPHAFSSTRLDRSKIGSDGGDSTNMKSNIAEITSIINRLNKTKTRNTKRNRKMANKGNDNGVVESKACDKALCSSHKGNTATCQGSCSTINVTNIKARNHRHEYELYDEYRIKEPEISTISKELREKRRCTNISRWFQILFDVDDDLIRSEKVNFRELIPVIGHSSSTKSGDSITECHSLVKEGDISVEQDNDGSVGNSHYIPPVSHIPLSPKDTRHSLLSDRISEIIKVDPIASQVLAAVKLSRGREDPIFISFHEFYTILLSYELKNGPQSWSHAAPPDYHNMEARVDRMIEKRNEESHGDILHGGDISMQHLSQAEDRDYTHQPGSAAGDVSKQQAGEVYHRLAERGKLFAVKRQKEKEVEVAKKAVAEKKRESMMSEAIIRIAKYKSHGGQEKLKTKIRRQKKSKGKMSESKCPSKNEHMAIQHELIKDNNSNQEIAEDSGDVDDILNVLMRELSRFESLKDNNNPPNKIKKRTREILNSIGTNSVTPAVAAVTPPVHSNDIAPVVPHDDNYANSYYYPPVTLRGSSLCSIQTPLSVQDLPVLCGDEGHRPNTSSEYTADNNNSNSNNNSIITTVSAISSSTCLRKTSTSKRRRDDQMRMSNNNNNNNNNKIEASIISVLPSESTADTVIPPIIITKTNSRKSNPISISSSSKNMRDVGNIERILVQSQSAEQTNGELGTLVRDGNTNINTNNINTNINNSNMTTLAVLTRKQTSKEKEASRVLSSSFSSYYYCYSSNNKYQYYADPYTHISRHKSTRNNHQRQQQKCRDVTIDCPSPNSKGKRQYPQHHSSRLDL